MPGVEDFTGGGALGLCAIERDRGVAKHFLGSLVARGADGDADRGRREHLMPVHLERLLERDAQPLGDAHRIARVLDVVQQHVELVSTEPRQRRGRFVTRDGVGGPQARLKPSRDRHQQAIGGERPETVADHIEPVEAKSQEGERGVRAPFSTLDRTLDEIEKQQPVRQAGERVRQLCLGDVGKRAGQPGGRAGVVPDRRAAAQHPPIHAVAVEDPVFVFVVLAAVSEVRRQRAPDALEVLVVHSAEPLVGARANLVLVVAEHRLSSARTSRPRW